MVFRSDPCGFTCLIMTYGAVLYADYVVVRWIVLQTMSDSLWGAFNALLFNTVIFLLIWAHTRDDAHPPVKRTYPFRPLGRDLCFSGILQGSLITHKKS